LCSCAVGDGKNAHLKTLEDAEERLQLVKADMLDYGSVASAVAGCQGVFHVASPVPSGKSSNPEVILLKKKVWSLVFLRCSGCGTGYM
jgi:hypothetical protein